MENNEFNPAVEETQNSNKSQAWKTALATSLGLAVGAGTAVAAGMIMNGEEEPEVEGEVVEVAPEETAAAAKPAPAHAHTAPKAKSEPAEEPEDMGEEIVFNEQPAEAAAAQPVMAGGVNLPDYHIDYHEVTTKTNGGHVDVAYGHATNANGKEVLCALVDENMDGVAEKFIYDTNGDMMLSDNETIDLVANNIVVRMDHLNEAANVHVQPQPEPEVEVITIPDEDVTLSDNTSEGDTVITIHHGQNIPEYSNDSDLAMGDSGMGAETDDTSALLDNIMA